MDCCSAGIDLRDLLVEKTFGTPADEAKSDVGEEGANMATTEEAELSDQLQPERIKQVFSSIFSFVHD